MYTVSLDSGTPEQIAALWAEVERTLGYANDPLFILIAIEVHNPDHIRGQVLLKDIKQENLNDWI